MENTNDHGSRDYTNMRCTTRGNLVGLEINLMNYDTVIAPFFLGREKEVDLQLNV